MNLTLSKLDDQTLGLYPLECGDDPNCLGGYSTILDAHDAAMEPLGSRWGYSIPPAVQTVTPANSANNSTVYSVPACNCFAGTPIVGADGVCRCVDNPPPADKTNDGAANGTNAVAGSDTLDIAGFQVSKNLLLFGAIGIGAFLLLKGNNDGR